MDWGCVLIDSVQPDLGGIRIKGRAMIETLISSGIEGRPAVVVKYPIEFDKLIELPEWLSENVQVCAQLRNIRTQVENDADTDEGKLQIQTDVHFGISANVRDKVKLLSDAYGTGNECIKLETEQISACGKVILSQCFETVRGTVITDENSPDIGSIIAVRALPDMAEISKTDGGTGITGIIEADVLYMPSGGERPSTTHVELPFEMNLRETLAEHPLVRLHVVSAEANALMSDRIEMKIVLCADYESRILHRYDLVKSAETLETLKKKRGYVVCWPSDSDDSWSIGKRYGIAEEAVRKAVGEGSVSQGNAIILCT
ncbi:MAG: hypothetical protein IJA26_06515 [Clostridia bacterium]|nr:hypothetical protein [Clostridia bacterium]